METATPHTSGRPVWGETGNIDNFYITRPAPEIQAQSPVFPSITPSLPGKCRELER